MPTIEQMLFATEYLALLPFIYAMKLWQAHTEFTEELLNAAP
jgi:hypothetical protein